MLGGWFAVLPAAMVLGATRPSSPEQLLVLHSRRKRFRAERFEAPATGSQQTEIVVQYESLCPDSVEIFRQDLGLRDAKEVYNGSDFHLVLMPYGNVRKNASADYGGRQCQHLDNECYGNAWQTCTLSELGASNDKALQHIFCLMNLPKTDMPDAYWNHNQGWTCGSYKECVVDQCNDTITVGQKMAIQNCVGELKANVPSKGLELMKSYEATRERWNMTHVPWVVINDKHEEALDDLNVTLVDFIAQRSGLMTP